MISDGFAKESLRYFTANKFVYRLLTDIDECIDLNMISECYNNSICFNTIGSFACVCPQGLRNNSNDCLDIDECFENNHDCKNGSKCQNTFGSYSCQCESGFKWNMLTLNCTDINECELENRSNLYETICDEHSTCINTEGSYVCECEAGWSKTDLIYCSGY